MYHVRKLYELALCTVLLCAVHGVMSTMLKMREHDSLLFFLLNPPTLFSGFKIVIRSKKVYCQWFPF